MADLPSTLLRRRGVVLAILPDPQASPTAHSMRPSDIKRCVAQALRATPHEVIDLGEHGILVHAEDMLNSTAVIREIESIGERLALGFPLFKTFHLPNEREALHHLLEAPGTVSRPELEPFDLDVALRGIAVDDYRRDEALWSFMADDARIAGYDARIDLEGLAVRLSLPLLTPPDVRARVELLATARLLAAFGKGNPAHRHPQFIRLPDGYSAAGALWRTLEDLPAATLGSLVVEVIWTPTAKSALARLRRLGIQVCVAGLDWSSVPPEATEADWLRGRVSAATKAEVLAKALKATADGRTIADVADNAAALEEALAAGFTLASGLAAAAEAARRQAQMLVAKAESQLPS